MNHQAPINLRDLFREDRKALIALALFFIANLIGTWQRWTQPLITQGREVSTPARIINGEKLYTDIQSVFGPFAPYFNAALYKVFGIDLIVLKISGALCALIILVTIFWISRQLMSVWKSTAATAAVIVICALKSTANYIQPYSFAALYCLVFSLAAIAFLLVYLQTGKRRNFLWVGLFLGLSATAKLDSAIVVLVTIIAVLLLEVMEHRRLPLQELLYLSVSSLAVICPIYGYIMLTTPLSVLLKNNYIFLFNIPSQVLHFNRILSGLAKWPTSFWFSLSGVAMLLIWAGTGALLGALISYRKGDQWRELLGIGAILLAAGLIWREISILIFQTSPNNTPFASAIFVLPVIVGRAIMIVWRNRKAGRQTPPDQKILAVISIFSFLSILRAAFNVTISGPFTPFLIPVLVVVYIYLLFEIIPAIFIKSQSVRNHWQQASALLVASMILAMAVNSTIKLRREITFQVSSSRGSFITSHEIGEPLAEAVKYVREHTPAGASVLTLPLFTTVNFLADRDYPLKEELALPGFLSDEKEMEAIEQIKSHNVNLILIVNITTPAFGNRVFGADYNLELMRWIAENYHLAARFDPKTVRNSGGPKLGDTQFFIMAYEKN